MDVIDKGLRAAIVGNGTLNTAVGGRVYAVLAPYDAAMPFIVYQLTGGGTDNDTAADSLDVRYVVKVVGTDAQVAQLNAKRLRDLLHENNFAIDSPYTVIRCQHVAFVNFAEVEERQSYWHAGGIYRIRISK